MSNNQQKPNQEANKTDRAERKAASAISRLATEISIYVKHHNADNDQRRAEQHKKDSQETLTRRLAYGGALIALVGVALNIGQLRTAHETLYGTQRAILTLGSPVMNYVRMKANGSIIDGFALNIGFENGGSTTARNVVMVNDIKSLSEAEYVSFRIPDEETIPINPRFPIAPHQHINSSPIFLSLDTIKNLETGNQKRHIIYFGQINYDDIFGKKHQTDFCFDFTGTMRPLGQEDDFKKTSPWGRTCPYHNCVDEDCNGFKQRKNILDFIP